MERAVTSPAEELAARRERLGMAAAASIVAVPARPALRSEDIYLGDNGAEPIGVDIAKLIAGRLLIQGASGAGKSWTLRRLLEQSVDRVQQVIIDPEGEFRELAEAYDHLVLDAHLLDSGACGLAARRAREHRVSVLLNLSELDREGQMKSVAAVLSALVEAPREHWHPVLVAIDEAHLFAPFGGQSSETTAVRKAAIAAVTDLMSRGRKRGLCGVLATQRLARLSKSVVSEAQNVLVGLNTLDLDIRRAAETIGWDARRAFDQLPQLRPGQFVGVGPAFSRSPATINVGTVKTQHRGAAPALDGAMLHDPSDAARLIDLDALLEMSQADQEVREEKAFLPGLKAIRGFLREPAFVTASRIWAALRPLAPNGAAVDDLVVHLESTGDEVHAALALLDSFGAIEIRDEEPGRSVRIAQDMRS